MCFDGMQSLEQWLGLHMEGDQKEILWAREAKWNFIHLDLKMPIINTIAVQNMFWHSQTY